MAATVPPAVAERSEAEALFDFETGAPAHVRSSLGMEALRAGGGVALSMRRDPSQFWSKALGFGFTAPVTADLIGEVCAFYRAQETPQAVFQLAPSVLPADWADICEETGLTAGSSWVKLAAATDEALARVEEQSGPPPQLRIAPVTAEDATAWASVMMRVFEMPGEGLAEMTAATVGEPDWYPFAAWDGEELVGTATMHVRGETAQFFGGATLPHARNRGGQSGLLAARARAARAAGCRWLVAETGTEAPGTHNPSLHNMERAGFQVQYERQNWIWRSGAGS